MVTETASPPPPSPSPPMSSINIKFKYIYRPITVKSYVYFDEDLVFPADLQRFCNVLQATFKDVFVKVVYDGKLQRFCLTVGRDILSLKFLNGFNIALGYTKKEHIFDVAQLINRTISADVAPSLLNAIPSLKFLTNVVEPSMIGG